LTRKKERDITWDVKETLRPVFFIPGGATAGRNTFERTPVVYGIQGDAKDCRNGSRKGEQVKNRLEEIRNSKGIRQEEFAKLMGVSRQTISSLENGKYNPSILLAHKIASYFGMPIEEMFLFEEEDK